MTTPIAMGKIAADGTILKATPGVVISTEIEPGTIHGSDIGYKVTLPARLVNHGNYIVQLTAEDYEENSDFVFTTIALRYQNQNGFEVLIWADKSQTSPRTAMDTVRTPWHFVVYDI